MKHALIFLSLLAAVTAGLTTSCKKKKFSSEGNLEFSRDTVIFDTVFTTIGSTTKQFKVYNRDNKKITIDEIELMGGQNSFYRLNFDGLMGTSFSDIDLSGGDSLFCFVEVTLDPNNGTLPLIIEDSIRFRTNGADQYVKLAAWGQDAYFHYGGGNSGTWANDKPHVIYGVTYVDEGQTLNIPAGTDIYMHKLSFLYIFRGTLNINGTKEEPVTFQGDRLEAEYDDVAGQYYGIYLDSARPSVISYAKIKNAITGIHVESREPGFAGTPTLTLNNTEISNCASYGLLLFDGAGLKANNTLIHSNGIHAVIVLQGADFEFNHCDLLGYGTAEGTSPAVGISNRYGSTVSSIPHGDFNNCVIVGSNEDQIAFDTIHAGGVTIDINLRNTRINTTLNNSSGIYQSCYFSGDPAFRDTGEKDFRFWSISFLRDKGDPAFATGVCATDIEGDLRISPPDLGVYEF
jgi:hypothetical protein